MDIKDLLEIIPELLLLFIPGYIAIKISEKYGLEKKKENFDIIVYSIFCKNASIRSRFNWDRLGITCFLLICFVHHSLFKANRLIDVYFFYALNAR